ncbi:MAG TPA: hypothetical protein PK990_01715 [Salinivirgaceae bacterium]|nr:hypothetical protein [Salinivirgaceae bacterium]
MAAITRNNYEQFFIDYYDGNLSAQKVAELREFLRKNPDLQAEFEWFSNIKLKPLDKTQVPDFSFLKKKIDQVPFAEENADELVISLLEGDYPEEKRAQLWQWIQEQPKAFQTYERLKKAKLNTAVESLEKSVFYQIPDFENDAIDTDNEQWFAIAAMEGDLSENSLRKYHKWLNVHVEYQFDFLSTRLLPDTKIVYPRREELKRKPAAKIHLLTFTTTVAASLLIMLLVYRFLNDQNLNTTNNKLSTGTAERIEILASSKVEETHEKQILESPVATTVSSKPIQKRRGAKIATLQPRNFTIEIETIAEKSINLTTLPITHTLAVYQEPEPQIIKTEEGEVPNSGFWARTINFVSEAAKKNFGNKIPKDKFKFDYKLNDQRQIVYFAIETPVFAIERKK